TPRVEDRSTGFVTAEQRAGRAGRKAATARATAVVGERRAGSEVDVDEDRAEEVVGASTGADMHRVPSEPAEPGAHGQFPLQHGPGVDVRPPAERNQFGGDPLLQSDQPVAEQLV